MHHLVLLKKFPHEKVLGTELVENTINEKIINTIEKLLVLCSFSVVFLTSFTVLFCVDCVLVSTYHLSKITCMEWKGQRLRSLFFKL